jgi:outer membrane receptor protein involved in Fe transport
LGVEHRVSEAVSYDIETFYKSMDRLIVLDPAFSGFGDVTYINAGEGRAYGFEFMARHAPTGPFFGWVSYTLSHSKRAEDPSCTQKDSPQSSLWGTGRCWVPFDFDQRHIFSAQGGYNLPANLGVSAQIQYVTGNPTDAYDSGVYDVDGDLYTPLQIGSDNGGRLPPYMQTSFRIDHLREFRTWQIESYIDFLNAIRGVNPEFTQYSYDYRESAYVRGLPFIPNLGVEAKFFL